MKKNITFKFTEYLIIKIFRNFMLHIVMNIEYANYIKKDKLLPSIQKEGENAKN